MAGALALVVGPSGAGKDTLLGAAKTALAANPRFVFPRRVVTREAMAELEDALQRSLFDAGDSFMKLPETQMGRPDILDTMSPVAPK